MNILKFFLFFFLVSFQKSVVKRPDQAYNRPPTLGNLRKPSKADRKGYHYQPIASTSRQSPTFVLDDDPIELELVHDPGPSPRSLDYSSA